MAATPTRSILMVTSGLAVGGSELQLCQLAIGLRQRGWKVHVVSLQPGGSYRRWLVNSGIQITEIRIGRFAHPSPLARLAAVIRASAPDIVHTQAFRANLWGRVALRRLNPPLIASLRATYTYYPRAYYPIERILGRWTDRIISPSIAAAHHLVAVVGLPASKVTVIPNGVDTEMFARSRDDALGFRRRLSLDGAFLVLAPGRLVRHKEHATIIEAFGSLLTHRPTSVLVVAGAGPLAHELARRAAPFGENVRFVGELSREDMIGAMGAADVVCLMSRSEGMPNVILEAMAAGVPVVASAVDGTTEVVQDGATGWLVPPGDSSALAGRLIELADRPDTRAKLGRQARQAARQLHSLDLNVERHVNVYETVLASPRRRTG